MKEKKEKLFRATEECRGMGDEALDNLERYDRTAGQLICSLLAENEELKAEKRALWEDVVRKDAQIAALEQNRGAGVMEDEGSALSMVANASEKPKRTRSQEYAKPSCYIYLASQEQPPVPSPAKRPPPLIDTDLADVCCFNCLMFGHKYTDYLLKLRIFCRVCGTQGVSLPNCPNRCRSELPARNRRSR